MLSCLQSDAEEVEGVALDRRGGRDHVEGRQVCLLGPDSVSGQV